MSRIGYILNCVIHMDYARLLKTVGSVHKKSGKGRIGLFVDIIKCGLKYGTGYTDYELNEWWTLNAEQRSTYITRGINNTIMRKCNSPEDYHLLNNKDDFNKLFDDCLGRKWIKVSEASFEDFEKFMDGLTHIIIKPLDSCCGAGVRKLSRDDYSSLRELYDLILSSGSNLAEEYIVQHSEMSKLYPLSVNTLRIVTVLDKEGEAHIIYAFVRVGNGGRVVDNLNAGGMAAPIDTERGVIANVAFDKDFNYYDVHPYTDTEFEGFVIPRWEEAKELVLRAAKRVPTLRYVGWDVAVTENNVVFVEANQHPGHDLLQMPRHTPDKIGILPKFRQYIDI